MEQDSTHLHAQTKPRRRGLWTVLGIVGIILAAFGCYAMYDLLSQNPPGYCVPQKRHIADDEYIRTADALYEWDLNRDRKRLPDGRINKKKDDDKEWYQKWERSRNQPGCCHVYRGDTQSTIRRMLGWQKVEVTLFPDPESRGDRQIRFAFDVCGKLLPHEFGFHPGTGYAITTSNYQEVANLK